MLPLFFTLFIPLALQADKQHVDANAHQLAEQSARQLNETYRGYLEAARRFDAAWSRYGWRRGTEYGRLLSFLHDNRPKALHLACAVRLVDFRRPVLGLPSSSKSEAVAPTPGSSEQEAMAFMHAAAGTMNLPGLEMLGALSSNMASVDRLAALRQRHARLKDELVPVKRAGARLRRGARSLDSIVAAIGGSSRKARYAVDDAVLAHELSRFGALVSTPPLGADGSVSMGLHALVPAA